MTNVTVGPIDLESSHRELQRRAQETMPEDVAVTIILQHGPAAQRIVDAAEGHDLVVMGTHGRVRLGEAPAGSVSRAVVHALHGAVFLTRAPTSVATAPDGQPDQT